MMNNTLSKIIIILIKYQKVSKANLLSIISNLICNNKVVLLMKIPLKLISLIIIKNNSILFLKIIKVIRIVSKK